MTEAKVIGIKESLELLKAVELVSVAGVEIAKDGLDASDLEKAYELVKKADVIVEGVKGLDQVDDEVKDLDEQEYIQLGMAAFSLVKNVAKAVKKEVVA